VLTLSSRVALVKLSVPIEDNPPALGVQYFTVCHCSVTMTSPLWFGGQDFVYLLIQVLITSSGGAV
jgi:hypothetical protein